MLPRRSRRASCMPKRDDRALTRDMIEACDRIIAYAADSTLEAFLHDYKTQDAIVRNLEIIGEASKNLTGTFTRAHPGIDWTSITRMRDKLIHHYFGVDA